jgi:LPS-assembly lipoprotein
MIKTIPMSRLLRGALAGLALLLSGCGFHLAGSDAHPLPAGLHRVHIDMVQPYRVSEPPLQAGLRTLLLRRGADVVKSVDAQVSVIRLTNLKEDREVLSIGVDGVALEYRLITRVSYEVIRAGQVLIPEDDLSVTRDFSFNSDEVLSKESEQDAIRKFMQSELAQLILFRVEAGLNTLQQSSEAPKA